MPHKSAKICSLGIKKYILNVERTGNELMIHLEGNAVSLSYLQPRPTDTEGQPCYAMFMRDLGSCRFWYPQEVLFHVLMDT